jgi:nucleotide-binding universal stress UspA family protein
MKQHATRRWLLAIDGSLHANRAAGYVSRYAGQLRVDEVYVLNVQPLGSYRAYALYRNETLLDAQEQAMQDTEVARKLLVDAGVPHRFHAALGDPAESIVQQCETEDVDEVVLGSHGLGAVVSAALGSVTHKVVHRASIPVSVIGDGRHDLAESAPRPDHPYRVLLAVDGSEHALRAVSYVCGFAGEGIDLEAVLLNVQLPILSGNVRSFVPRDMIDTYYRQEGAEALRAAKAALTEAGIQFETRVMAGHIAQTIGQLAEESKCSRIVMGTRGLGAIGSVVLGSTAYNVLHLATLPITLVK